LLHFFHKLETASAVVPGTQSAAGPPCVRRFYRTTPAPHTQWSRAPPRRSVRPWPVPWPGVRGTLFAATCISVRFNLVSRACGFIVSKLSQTTV